ncbi:MAG: TolC family protein [Bacteroidota bacterium]
MKINYSVFIFCLLLFNTKFIMAQNPDLDLSSALTKALENNYDLTISEKDLEIASLNNTWGIAGRYPTISFDVNNVNSIDNDRDQSTRLTAGIGLNWLLFDGFRVNITKDQLELKEELSSGLLALNVENTVEDIILAYNNVLLQKETLKVFRDLRDLSYDRYNYEMKKHELGGSVTYNVLQAKNIYLADKAMYLRQEVEVRNAIRTLNFLMGEEAGKVWSINAKMEVDTSQYILSDLQQKMMNNNRVIRNQFINIQLRVKETRLRKSEYYPSLQLSAGIQNSYNRNALAGTEAVTSSSIGPYINLNLSYLLNNGGNRKRSVEMAEINEEIAGVETEQIQHSLNNELLSIYDNYRLRVELLNVAEEGIEAAELNLGIAEDKFKSGVINSFNYRDIQLIYLNAALEKLNATFSLIASHAALTRITGGFVNEMGETESRYD